MSCRRGSHSLYDVRYHFIWVTKYRYHVLRGAVAERARELIRQSCLAMEIEIQKGHVSKDHVHVFASCPATLSPAEIMKRLKGRSSRKLQQEFPHLKKRYWGNHFWARGYFCATVETVTEEAIRDYIEKHDRESPNEDFAIGD